MNRKPLFSLLFPLFLTAHFSMPSFLPLIHIANFLTYSYNACFSTYPACEKKAEESHSILLYYTTLLLLSFTLFFRTMKKRKERGRLIPLGEKQYIHAYGLQAKPVEVGM